MQMLGSRQGGGQASAQDQAPQRQNYNQQTPHGSSQPQQPDQPYPQQPTQSAQQPQQQPGGFDADIPF